MRGKIVGLSSYTGKNKSGEDFTSKRLFLVYPLTGDNNIGTGTRDCYLNERLFSDVFGNSSPKDILNREVVVSYNQRGYVDDVILMS